MKNTTDSFIPALSKKLQLIIVRLSIFSGLYLSVVQSIKYIEQIIGLSPLITFGGTTMLILASVSIETIGQIQARGTSQSIAKQKKTSIASSSTEDKVGGLL